MWLLDNNICMTCTSGSPLYLLGHVFQTLNCSFCLPFQREESIQLVFMRKCCLFSSPSHVRKLRTKAVKIRSQTLTLKQSLDMLRTTERTLLPAWGVGHAFQLTLKPEAVEFKKFSNCMRSNIQSKASCGYTCLGFRFFHPGRNTSAGKVPACEAFVRGSWGFL